MTSRIDIANLLYKVAFRCYDSGEIDDIPQWFKGLPANVQGAITVVIEHLRSQARWQWRGKRYKPLKGALCIGLGRIATDIGKGDEKVRYRILGYDRVEKRDFVLLIGFDKSTDPDFSKNCPKALSKKSEVENDDSRIRDFRPV